MPDSQRCSWQSPGSWRCRSHARANPVNVKQQPIVQRSLPPKLTTAFQRAPVLSLFQQGPQSVAKGLFQKGGCGRSTFTIAFPGTVQQGRQGRQGQGTAGTAGTPGSVLRPFNPRRPPPGQNLQRPTAYCQTLREVLRTSLSVCSLEGILTLQVLEDDKRATTNVQNGLVLLLFFSYYKSLTLKKSPGGKLLKKCEKVWKSLKKCEQVPKPILPLSCCPLVFL